MFHVLYDMEKTRMNFNYKLLIRQALVLSKDIWAREDYSFPVITEGLINSWQMMFGLSLDWKVKVGTTINRITVIQASEEGCERW